VAAATAATAASTAGERGNGHAVGDDADMKVFHLDLPARAEDIAKLEIGAAVYLNGIVYTAREGVYKRVLQEGQSLPMDDLGALSNANFHCSPAAAEDGQGGYSVGAVTATASFRFSQWMGRWIDQTGARLIIGKGGMPAEDYRQVLAPRGAIYLTTVGYGTGALLGRGIRRVRDVHWLKELGIAQAMWVFEVKDFGPFIVESDVHGNSLFAQHGEQINAGIEALYAGLKPPALHRYGESQDRRHEVM
jgi:L(+)-tartrate dehydratase beta subunit